jgi:hypothetical protein
MGPPRAGAGDDAERCADGPEREVAVTQVWSGRPPDDWSRRPSGQRPGRPPEDEARVYRAENYRPRPERGLPAALAVVIALAAALATLVALGVPRTTHLGVARGAAFVIGALVAVLLVRGSRAWAIATAVPLIYAALILTLYLLGTGLRAAFTLAVLDAPLLWGTAGAVAVVAFLRHRVAVRGR